MENVYMMFKWATATPYERSIAKSIFFIPKPAKWALFPTRTMSMWDMLKFEHPPITSTHPDSIHNLDNFFSLEPPHPNTTEVIKKLHALPLPDRLLIQRLNIYSRDCWMNGAVSVRYAHIPGEEMCFPLWVVSYCDALLTHVMTVQKPWEKNLAHGTLHSLVSMTVNPYPLAYLGYPELDEHICGWRSLRGHRCKGRCKVWPYLADSHWT